MALLSLIKVEDDGLKVDIGITRRTEINEDNPVPEGKTKILPLRIPQIPEETKPEEFERCFYCRQLTSIPVGTPVNKMKHYIEGLGPVHKECEAVIKSGDYFIDGANEKSPFPNPNYHRTNYHNI